MKRFLLAVFFFVTTLTLATAAFLSDQEVSLGNKITAGTLDLTLNEAAGADVIESETWQPGDEIEAAVTLRNNGTLPIGGITLQAQTNAQK